jgi:hypothetical protein
MSKALSTHLEDPASVPYFLWDEPMSVAELRERLATSSAPEKARLLGKILREARDQDVWAFITPQEIARNWQVLSHHLGRRREFWRFLIDGWQRSGLLDA